MSHYKLVACACNQRLLAVSRQRVRSRALQHKAQSRGDLPSQVKNIPFDLALLSNTRQHIQEKTDRLSIFTYQVGLTISLKKTEAMCVDVPTPTEIRLKG